MQRFIDFIEIVKDAWREYDASRPIATVEDISAKVSTNFVFRIRLKDETCIIAKLSYFGKFEHFVEDHTIVNALATNLPAPFENFVAKSLTKYGQLFVHRYTGNDVDAWVVFYNPIRVNQRPAKKQSEEQIRILGRELAQFHRACTNTRNALPPNHKQIKNDLDILRDILKTDVGQWEHRGNVKEIHRQCDLLEENFTLIGVDELPSIPVFVDWNIGNFSVDQDYQFFSRWDYDWFRMSTRVMDFYFFSRVCSSIGDRTIFSYLIDPLMEDRFTIFLKSYHAEFPLTEEEIKLIKECYRFFIINYVVKDGRYFFNEVYASRLQQEAFSLYFPQLDTNFREDHLWDALA
ncbi:MAG: hypothetical protein AAF616_08345 [Bacteroidota bacterium]